MTTLRAPSRLVMQPLQARCAHCGLDVPRGLIELTQKNQYCCAGCRAVFIAIQECGLDKYYSIQHDLQTARMPVAALTSRRFEEFDDVAFQTKYCQPTAQGLLRTQLAIEGIHCAACVWLIEKLPNVLSGVVEASVNFSRRTLMLTWDPAAVRLSGVASRLASFGYIPHAISDRVSENIRRAEDRRSLVNIAVAGALAGNIMLLAFGLYGGTFHGIEVEYFQFFRWLSMMLAIVSLAWPGRVFFRGAINALRTRTPSMDIPIAIGLAAGMTWSSIATLRGEGEVYFDSIGLLVFLLLVGRWIQLRQQRRSRDALEMLYSMTPRYAHLVEGGAIREVFAESLLPEQIIEIRSGETSPVDGVVLEGASSINLAWLTGESQPTQIAVGDTVLAGSLNAIAPIRVRVAATGAATRAGRLMQIVQQCADRRAPIIKLADRIAGVFVVIVLTLAVLTAAFWWRIDSARAIENAIALLIITCPCALGLATPLAIVAAIGRAASRGILIKGGEVIEALTRRPGTIFLDKTGTLTEGRMEVRRWHGADDLKPLVAAIEQQCSHPIASALTRLASKDDSVVQQFNFVKSLGNGVSAMVRGRHIIIGSLACIQGQDVSIPRWAGELAKKWTHELLSPVYVAIDKRLVAMAGVGDSIKPGAAIVVSQLQQLGWSVKVLSGDHPAIVSSIASSVGINELDCRGGVSPEEKLSVVEQAAKKQSVIMVGDGVNDAAALSAATVGVAVRGGAEASLASADVYLNTEWLDSLVELLHGSRLTYAAVRRGLMVSLAYNIIGSSLAIAGLIDPIVAAVLMPLSSLTVITLAFRARTFGGGPCR